MQCKLYIGITCGFFGQVGQTEGIYWECVWFGGRGRAVRMYILRVRMI